MPDSSVTTAAGQERQNTAAKLPPGWLSRWPWATFLLPMAVYMLVGSLEPPPPKEAPIDPPVVENAAAARSDSDQIDTRSAANPLGANDGAGAVDRLPEANSGSPQALAYRSYPQVYMAKIVLTLFAVALVWRGYRTFAWRISGLSVGVGVVGVVLWIVLCHLRLEPKIIGPVDRFLGGFIPGLEEGGTPSVGLMSMLGTGERSAFNPLKQLADAPGWAYTFLAIRFFGLAILVPVIEEFFLRGFLMRYVQHEAWWKIPFGTVNRMAIIAGTLVPMLMHPGELLASFVWFSMVTWLMVRTRSIWDCVIAHAVTNFLLGVYVVWWDQWQLM